MTVSDINDQYTDFLRMMDLIEQGDLDTLLQEFDEEVQND